MIQHQTTGTFLNLKFNPKINKEKGLHVNFACELLHSYFDECQENNPTLIFTLF